MEVLSQFNFDSPLPTFFELYAQERLSLTLNVAFEYCFAVCDPTMPPF